MKRLVILLIIASALCIYGGINPTADWFREGSNDYSYLGKSVSGMGDFNGDGKYDVIISANREDYKDSLSGAVYIYYGGADSLSDNNMTKLGISQPNTYFGQCVDFAGDVNNDGYDDLIVGAIQYRVNDTLRGAAFCYMGSDSGLVDTFDWMITGESVNSYLGESVSGAGDVNNDGYDDVIIGSPDYSNGQTREGKVYLYLGGPSGLEDIPVWEYESDQEHAYLGYAVSDAGNIDNDDYDDFIIGAYSYTDAFTDEGLVILYCGQSDASLISESWSVESGQEYSYFGYSISEAGDVNNDGYSDIIIGAHQYDNGENGEGRAYVFLGSGTGFADSADWIGEIDLSNVHFGYAVSSAGDVNIDGYDDIIVGSDWYGGSGGAFVYYGNANGLNANYSWVSNDTTSGGDYGTSHTGIGDVNGDGYNDILVGKVNYDGAENNMGAVFVYCFRGFELTGSSKPYDFGFVETDMNHVISDYIISNTGMDTLRADSIKTLSSIFFIDSVYNYPLIIDTAESFSLKVAASSPDTGIYSANIYVYHRTICDFSLEVTAHFALPLYIDSVVAKDGSNAQAGIDDDDFVLLYFSEQTNAPALDELNIDNILTLSNSHKWIDGFGLIDTAFWNPQQTILYVDLSTNISAPTISVGDTVYPDNATITSTYSGLACHYPIVITGSFDPVGIDNVQYLKTDIKADVFANTIQYSVSSSKNYISIYNVLGEKLYKRENINIGSHSINTDFLAPGIYFIKFEDNDKLLNKSFLKIK